MLVKEFAKAAGLSLASGNALLKSLSDIQAIPEPTKHKSGRGKPSNIYDIRNIGDFDFESWANEVLDIIENNKAKADKTAKIAEVLAEQKAQQEFENSFEPLPDEMYSDGGENRYSEEYNDFVDEQEDGYVPAGFHSELDDYNADDYEDMD